MRLSEEQPDYFIQKQKKKQKLTKYKNNTKIRKHLFTTTKQNAQKNISKKNKTRLDEVHSLT
jgi:hypothetical protein